MKFEVNVQADTNVENASVTNGNGVLEVDTDGSDEVVGTITVLDQEENKLINAQDITA